MRNCVFNISVIVIFSFLVEPALAKHAVSSNFLNDVYKNYQAITATWYSLFLPLAQRLFWSMALISLVWTMGFQILGKADLTELLGSFVRFIITTGLFYFFLVESPHISTGLIQSLERIVSQVSHNPSAGPSGIVDNALTLLSNVTNNSDAGWGSYIIMSIVALFVVAVYSLIAVNVLVQYIALWVLVYAGIILLGFGGAHWTREVAINYFKQILAVCLKIFTTCLIINISSSFLVAYKITSIQDILLLAISTTLIYVVSTSVPNQIAGLVFNSQALSGTGAATAGGVVGMAVGASSAGLNAAKSLGKMALKGK